MALSSDPKALSLLEEVMASQLPSDRLNQQLRKTGHSIELISWVLQQRELRQRAVTKLGELAHRLLFTRDGLEQASRLVIARYHAQRLKDSGSITDLGCGIGIDSFAFAEAGMEVVAIEQDSETAAIAAANLQEFQNAIVLTAAAEDVQVQTKAVWFDPARRDLAGSHQSRKMLSAADFSPSLDLVFDTLRLLPGGAKLAPGFPHELIPAEFEANWVSNNRELVELTIFSVDKERAGKRFATMVSDSGVIEFTGEIAAAPIEPVQSYVYEPDPALIRSRLLGAFANELGLTLIAPEIAYLSSEQEIQSPWLRSYRVLEELPLDRKAIRKRLTELGIGVLEIKKRGVDIDPAVFRKELKLKGEGAATLILTRVGDARRALVCAKS